MMFFSGVLSSLQRAVQDVDLPEPVGPVVEHGAVGLGERAAEARRARAPGSRACRARGGCSPCRGCAGRRTRRGRSGSSPRGRRRGGRRSSARRGRPAGSRRSAMSRSAMILIRETTPETIRFGTVVSSVSTPSIRIRTRSSRPARPLSSGWGSKWMSDAPCSVACAMIECTSLITGASSADSRRSTTSSTRGPPRPPLPPPGRRPRSGSSARSAR